MHLLREGWIMGNQFLQGRDYGSCRGTQLLCHFRGCFFDVIYFSTVVLIIRIKPPDLESLQCAQHKLAALIWQFHPVQDVGNCSYTVKLRSRLDLTLLSLFIAFVGFSHHEADNFFFTDLITNPTADHTVSTNHRQNSRENWTLINRKDWNAIR